MSPLIATSLPSLPPAMDPLNSSLPPLSSGRLRTSLPIVFEDLQTPNSKRGPTRLPSPSGPMRPSALPTLQPIASTPVVPSVRSASSQSTTSGSSSEKSIRKTISIAAFPQPPKSISTSIPATPTSSQSSKTGSIDSATSVSTTNGRSRAPLRVSTAPPISTYRVSQTPSLLNEAGDGKSIPILASHRASDCSNASAPHSRSSSAQGSCSTAATTFEDTDDPPRRARHEVEDGNDGSKNTKSKEAKGNVIVSVRVRPDTTGSESPQAEGEWMVDGRRSLVAFRGREGGDYHYDNVFATHDNNAKVYDSSAKRLVRRVMEGYHATVFAYGMTGTGKTFSMQGTATSPGVIPLAITDIFSYIRETPHREFLLRVSYLEIYNEKIYDLLSMTAATSNAGAGQQEEIRLREDSKRGVYATPLKEEIVQSPTQLLRVIARGDYARRTSSTQYNARSSRSHAVVQIVVESRERVPLSASMPESSGSGISAGGVRVSTLSLIDLAGSERVAESKERRTEGAHINKSLLTLGTVIGRLSGDKERNGNPTDREGNKHLPYRDSKLTRLLQPALSGNSLVSILCTIQIGCAGSAASNQNHTGETLNTLKFAARAKNNIVSHAKRAEEAVGSGANAGLLERYRSEIMNLRGQLDAQQKTQVDKEEKQLEKEAEQRHEEQMLEMQLARTALKERIEHLNRLILCSKSTGVNRAGSGSGGTLSMQSRLSGSTTADISGSRSVRSSASQSTLGAAGTSLQRHVSIGSSPDSPQDTLAASQGEDGESIGGDFADGVASLQAQNRALQADLQDKNRYISTLEKRLLQARRSSHSRMSMGFSALKSTNLDEGDAARIIYEKDTEVAELRSRLEDKERMVTALRSAARKREMAEFSPESSSVEYRSPESKKKGDLHRRLPSLTHRGSGSSSPIHVMTPPAGPTSQALATEKTKRTEMEEMSKMLDDLVQNKVESGHMVMGRSGSVHVANGYSRRPSNHRTRPSSLTTAHHEPASISLSPGVPTRKAASPPLMQHIEEV